MRTDEMNEEMRLEAIRWQERRLAALCGQDVKLPEDAFPKTGMVAIADDGRRIAAGMLYLEANVPVAVCGFLFVNPDAGMREKRDAIRLVLSVLPVYARKLGAQYVFSVFGRGSVNRALDRMGCETVESSETKILWMTKEV